MSDQLVSIVIVTYNRMKELKRAINSILNQSYDHIEIIIVDNGSTDNTVKMIKNDFPDIYLVKMVSNIGCPQGRNIGVDYCQGHIIFFLDDDAWLESNVIKKIIIEFERNSPSLSVIMPNMVEYNSGYITRLVNGDKSYRIYNFLGGVSAIKRNVFKEVGGFIDTFYGSEELFMSILLYSKGYSIKIIGSIFAHHKPSFIRDSNELLIRKIKNDFYWVWIYSPYVVIILIILWKCIVWLGTGVRRKKLLQVLKGIRSGISPPINFMKKNRSPIDIITLFSFLIKRRKSIL